MGIRDFSPFGTKAIEVKFNCNRNNCNHEIISEEIEVPSPDYSAENHSDSIRENEGYAVCSNCGAEYEIDIQVGFGGGNIIIDGIADDYIIEIIEHSEEYDTNPDPELNTDNSFGFADIVDMINPLQHIPIVSGLYQSATGDTIGSIATIVGGAIFGGPLGALISAGMVAYKAAQSDSSYQQDLTELEGTTIAMADLRQGYKPYNT